MSTEPDPLEAAFEAAEKACDGMLKGPDHYLADPAVVAVATVEAAAPHIARATLLKAADQLIEMTADPFDLLTESVGIKGPIAIALWLRDRAEQG